MRPMMAVMPKSLGVKTAATPGAQRFGVGGRDDPADHHRHVPAPARRSRRSTSGTSSACAPERIDRPTQCTSSATAAAAICSGVSRMPW